MTARAERAGAVDEPHLLVVDDDSRLRDLLRRYLVDQGFRVTTAGDAAEARAKIGGMDFDLLILDVMMPGEDGFALTKSLRETSRIPILLLTARAETEDRINGLERGADDYLVKNVLARAAAMPEKIGELRLGACRLDLKRGELYRGAAPVKLTSAEQALLMTLAGQPDEAMSREDLARAAKFSGNLRTVDVQMTRLRRKIERDPKFPRYLQTVRGTGYVLKPD
jgi:two-component system phosphate regulon response regulator OmpR